VCVNVSSGTGSPRYFQTKGHKTVVVVVVAFSFSHMGDQTGILDH